VNAAKVMTFLRPTKRQSPWSYGFGAALFGWWSLDRWMGTVQSGADVPSVALTVALTSVCIFNGWWATKAHRGAHSRTDPPLHS